MQHSLAATGAPSTAAAQSSWGRRRVLESSSSSRVCSQHDHSRVHHLQQQQRTRPCAGADSGSSGSSPAPPPPPPPPPPPRPPTPGGGGDDDDEQHNGKQQHSDMFNNLRSTLAGSPQLLAVAAGGGCGALLVTAAWLLQAAGSTRDRLAVIEASLAGMADGESTQESVATLKRLLRELFAEQLGVKQRLAAADKAAGTQLEAADDHQLQAALGEGAAWPRAPVRATGSVCAAGALRWTATSTAAQEGAGGGAGGAVAQLAGLGAGAAAALRLQLHSALGGGKRRLTAELGQDAAAAAGAPQLQLQRLLYRVQATPWLQLMVAPLGGSLEVFGRSATPVTGEFGCTPTVRTGHGCSVLQHASGSGKALSMSNRHLSATAGFFVRGGSKAGISQLQVRSQDGKALSVIAAHCSSSRRDPASPQPQDHIFCIPRDVTPAAADQRQPLRFLGVQSPQQQLDSSSSSSSSQHAAGVPAGVVLGAVGVMPLGDAVTATAWAQQQQQQDAARRQLGWGAGLFVQPDSDGVEFALGLGRQPSNRALFCEVSAKVPCGGDGLSVSPCAVLTHAGGATSLAYVMQSHWRF